MPKKKVSSKSPKAKRKPMKVYMVYFTINGLDAEFKVQVFAKTWYEAWNRSRRILRPKKVIEVFPEVISHLNTAKSADDFSICYEHHPFEVRN